MSKYPGRIVSNLAPAGYSVFFDGTGDYLSNTANTIIPTTGDFTFETWVYPTQVSTLQYLIGTTNNSGNKFWVYINSSAYVGVQTGSSYRDSSTTKVVANAWNHIACTRTGSTYALFVNGVSQSISGVGTMASTLDVTPTYIGSRDAGNSPVTGYLSNVRVCNSVLYTAAFTPPTQLFNITNTSLLTCNSPAIIDQSNNAFAITANGNAAVSTLTPFTAYVPYNPALGASTPGVWTVDEAMQAAATRQWNMYDPYFNLTTLLLHGNPTTNVPTVVTDASTNNFTVTAVADARAAGLSPFSLTTYPSSGSAYLDGTGDYFSIADNVALDMGSSDFTIEFWTYVTGTPSTYQAYFGKRANTGTYGGVELYLTSSRNLNLQATLNGSTWGVDITTSSTVSLNTWTHVAAVRNGNTWIVYINGTAGATSGTVSGTIPDNASAFVIGAGASDGGHPMIAGYISNFRVVKGVAVYTGAFTTPTAPLTATQAAGTNISAITGTQTSLLTLQNSQSANNNAFLDSSSNNFLITRNGNTTQGSFSPFSQGGWSNYFDGTGDYLTVPNNAAFNLSTNDFTLELFWYPTTFQAGSLIECSSTSNYAFAIYAQASGAVQFYAGTGASASWNILSAIAMGTATLNAWNHIVVVRSGTTFSYYLNGTRTGQSTSVSAAIGQQAIGIGGNSVGASITGPGYISNIRLVNGTAVYSGTTLTVPTAPLTTTSQGATASQVELLTCQSNRFIDNSDNAFTITRNGDTSVQPFSPFYPTAAYTPATIGGSGYFDGTGDYLSTPDNAAFDLGTGDFTFECWLYKPNNNDVSMICSATSGLDFAYVSGSLRMGRYPIAWDDTVLYTIPQNAWTHIAFVKASGRDYLFANGTLLNPGGTANTNSYDVTTTLFIGVAGDTTSRILTGYMAGVRLIKGQALATASFTPPTAPVTRTAVGWSGANAATSLTGTVSLLLNYANAGVVDSTGKSLLETVGNAQISTAVSRFGGSSIAFDGTGDYLSSNPATTDLYAFGSGDFTIEMWLRLNSVTGTQVFYDQRPLAGGVYPTLYMSGSTLFYYANGANRITGSTLSTNQWYHIAVSRSGTSTRLFVDGTQSGSTYTDTNVYLNAALRPFIGGDGTNIGTGGVNGYIDELRITKGFARYTGNFTPQTSQWQDQ